MEHREITEDTDLIKSFKTRDKGSNFDTMTDGEKRTVWFKLHDIRTAMMTAANELTSTLNQMDEAGTLPSASFTLTMSRISASMMLMSFLSGHHADVYDRVQMSAEEKAERVKGTIEALMETMASLLHANMI